MYIYTRPKSSGQLQRPGGDQPPFQLSVYNPYTCKYLCLCIMYIHQYIVISPSLSLSIYIYIYVYICIYIYITPQLQVNSANKRTSRCLTTHVWDVDYSLLCDVISDTAGSQT